ncbi:DNA topoisomerase I [Candidatus Gottesmanbacteria bacterium RBG_16_43_7]|uniref:DNA topoisomerase 1 n=1 Tax=Candidatus Gottesmanbacteria bacterium RBG_16_43_7 TaxID=1798373 RepID=A0A1F5Z8L8_9BACT|nr:MAG: DNA topoisomerase I [Candidatus Gottesmanbacteria bacterium RBG_16_43_7]
MDLIIVESPTKAKTLVKFLDKTYRIEATMGHIRDLPKSELGVDIEHDFKPHYVTPRDKTRRVNELVDIARQANRIILATDPDREGEAIGWHIANILFTKLGASRSKKPSKSKTKKTAADYDRIVFHEITGSAIRDALKNPRRIDMPLVDAQQARRVLDRLVGYKLSPLLWQKLSRRWLSAGRVQSVVVRLVVEREREIAAFKRKKYYSLTGEFATASAGSQKLLTAELVSKDGQKYAVKDTITLFDGTYTTTATTIDTATGAQSIKDDFKEPFTVSSVDKKEIVKNPQPPFTTSTLQQEAARRFYFSAKKTMQVAQRLYEEGIITYHRTDSVNLSDKFIREARDYIQKTYSDKFLPKSPRIYTTKSKVAQEAHEAIRPTTTTLLSADLENKSGYNRDHVRLYDLIWKRALASQAQSAVFDSTTVVIDDASGYRFETQGSIIKFEGYLKITGRDVNEVVIPDVATGDRLLCRNVDITEHFTNPPPRYSEAALVKTLEEKDIGRPSTYAPIISTIQERNYVEREEKKFKPTQLGNVVTDFLVDHFAQIISLPFTATIENSLDKIAKGEKKWVPVIADFYSSFAQKLEHTYKTADRIKMAAEETGQTCPQCGSPLLIRIGRYGKFIACSTFPKCNYTRQFVETVSDVHCPRCGGNIIIKKSKRGKSFYGCSNYPKCTFAAWKKEDIK